MTDQGALFQQVDIAFLFARALWPLDWQYCKDNDGLRAAYK